jgi:N-sulfoglucosamine sulfohydrolase
MMAQRHASTVQKYFEAGFGKKPGEELFDIQADPGCMKNLAGEAGLQKVLGGLRKDLETRLRGQGDPRVTGKGDIWESYPRFSPTRPELGGFSKEGEYNPKYKPGK